MLSSGISSSQISYGTPRQIVAQSQTSSQVMYTVPTGKKFQGTVHSTNGGQTVGITPAGGSLTQVVVPGINVSYSSVSPMPITLVAGTVFTNLSSSGVQYLVGVETDA